MQTRPHEKKNIIIAGLFVFSLLALCGVSVFILGKERSVFERKITLYTEVDNAEALKTGAFVQFKGIKIGTVTSVDIVSLSKIRIKFSINQSVQEWIKKDSSIEFKTQGVLGDKFLEISGGSIESPIVDEKSYLLFNKGGGFQKLINKSEDIMVTATRVLQRMDRILKTIETTKLDETLLNLNQSSKSTKNILAAIKPKNVKNILSSMDKISNRVEKGPGTAHSLIYDGAIHDDIKTLLGGANRSKVLKYFIRESIKKNSNAN